jgi:MinD-like ATPase involved in chromosome partitioning or flagellar assembly
MARSVDSLKAFMAKGGRDDSYRLLPHVVVFGAGKGGVGTSALAGLAALHAARRGSEVLLVDADETVGSLHLMFGLQGEVPGLGSLRSGAVSPEDLVLEVAPGVTLFPGGGGGVDSTLSVASAERRMLLRRVSGLYDRFDLVVVDGGSRLDSVMAACAAGAGRLVGVTTPDRIAQAAVYALLKVTRGRFGALPTELLVNRATDTTGREVHQLVHSASASFLGTTVAYGGAVAEDAELSDLLSAGGTLADLAHDGPALSSIGGIADRFAAEAEAHAAPPAPVIPLHGGGPYLSR